MYTFIVVLNREVYAQFNRIERRNAMRLANRNNGDVRGRLFVRVTMWSVTAVVGVAIAVIYHSYSEGQIINLDFWNYFLQKFDRRDSPVS